MWYYATNFMGPVSLRWYEENNIPFTSEKKYSEFLNQEIELKNYEQYAGGRIDCYCNNPEDPDYDPYNYELGLPIMKSSSYGKLSKWLDTYKTKRLDKNVLKTFEKETGHKLEFFYKKDKEENS